MARSLQQIGTQVSACVFNQLSVLIGTLPLQIATLAKGDRFKINMLCVKQIQVYVCPNICCMLEEKCNVKRSAGGYSEEQRRRGLDPNFLCASALCLKQANKITVLQQY